jgi:hypothetical protein
MDTTTAAVNATASAATRLTPDRAKTAAAEPFASNENHTSLP